jgi:hypothetical protein
MISKKNPSNLEKIEYLFNFSRAGAMAQVIAMYGIYEYVSQVTEKERPKESSEVLFIDPCLWWDACKVLKEELEELQGS